MLRSLFVLLTVVLTDGVAAGLIGGALAGLGWWWLRRAGPVRGIEESVRSRAPLPLGPTFADPLLQLLAVGSGISLGREQAFRQAATAVLDRISRLACLGEGHRRILVASAAGAAWKRCTTCRWPGYCSPLRPCRCAAIGGRC